MISSVSLVTLEEFIARIPNAQNFLDGTDQFDLTILHRVHVQDVVVSGDASGRQVVKLALAVEGETALTIPDFDFITLRLGTSLPGFTFIKAELALGDSGYLELYDFRLALRFEQSLLRRYDLEKKQILDAPFQFEVDALLTIDASINLRFDLYNFMIPPFTIGNTGLILALENCQLDLGGDWSTAGLQDMLDNPDFHGIYAQKALLYWLPQLRFPAVPTPGLRLEFTDIALDEDGVSFLFNLNWQIVHTNGIIQPESELRGALFDNRFAVALGGAHGRVVQNIPQEMVVSGLLQLPLINTLLKVDFNLEGGNDADEFNTALTVEADPATPLTLDLGRPGWHIILPGLRLHGELSEDSFTVEGASGLQMRLPGLSVDLERAKVLFSSTPQGDTFSFHLINLSLGPLGTVEKAEMLVLTVRDERGKTTLQEFFLETQFSWQDLSSRLSIPADFPAPLDDVRVRVVISWEQDAAGANKIKLEVATELQDVDNLWAFLPSSLRPEVRNAKLALVVEYDSPDDFSGASQTAAFSGQMSANLEFRFPQLAALDDSDLIHIQTGDPQGWIDARFSITTDSRGQAELRAQVSNPISVDFNLPGLVQDSPLLHLALAEAKVALATRADDSTSAAEGEIVMSGNFAIHPIKFPEQLPIALHLEKLLKPLSVSAVVGKATATLKFKGDRLQLVAACEFEDARVDVDLFDMLANLARGIAAPADEADVSRAKRGLDLEVGFGLHHLGFQLGDLESIDSSAHALVELGMQFRLGSASALGHIRLSDQELAIGITELLIPLQLPRFPLTIAELDALRTDSEWETKLDRLEKQVDDLQALLDGTNDTAKARELGQLQTKLALLRGIWDVRQKVTGAPNKDSFQQNVRMFIDVMQSYNGLANGITNAQSKVQLKVSNVQAVFPFGDPRNLALEGSAGLIGFDAEDPFKVLEEMTLTAGISADMIFFSVDSLGTPIPIPDFGRYTQGSISLTKFSIGYGYTKNSFAAAFQGKVTLPPQFIADLDTSRNLGMGIRLPHYSSLAYRLDLIPIPGPIPVVPLFEFNLDLRSPGALGIASTDTCEPFYDGLELIVPNVIHADFKKLAFSPFLGVFPIPNLQFDGDLAIGDGSTGLTIVADNMLYLYGLYQTGPIPFFASPSEPYFDHLCIRLGMAGFGVNFNLERPFPTFDPLALLEVAGLIADPTMPIDPNGALANLVRMALTDAYFFLPKFTHVLFPEAREVNGQELNIVINVGTLIVGAQMVLQVIKASLDEINVAGKQLDRSLRNLANHPPDLSLGALLSALPSEVRTMHLAASFAGFEASAVILLISPTDAAQEFRNRDQPPQAVAQPRLSLGIRPDANAMIAWQPNLPLPGGIRASSPQDPKNNLFRGIEFESFDASDLVDIPAPRKPLAGVMVGTHVKVFGGQRYRFLGALFEDGSFAMISALDIRPLKLQVAGITTSLPLQFSGRLKLEGRQRRGVYIGELAASAWGRWDIIPRVAKIEIADQKNPASLEVYGDGKFAVKGSGQASLFNGAATIKGNVDISHTHAFVDGEMNYNVPTLVNLVLRGSTRFGPGSRFAMEGQGTLDILGNRISNVSGMVSESGVAIKANIDTTGKGSLAWRVAGQRVKLQMDVAGEFNLRKQRQPEFNLEGRGLLQLPDLGNTKISGRSYIRGKMKKRAYELVLGAEGSLDYLKKRWSEGYVEIGTRGTKLGGRTSFALNLTPTGIGNVLFANLFFKIDIQGAFELNTSAGMTDLQLNGDWLLAARFGEGMRQIIPLAAQKINPPLELESRLEWELLRVQDFTLIPNGAFQIPIPKLESDVLRFGLLDDWNPAISYGDRGLKTIPDESGWEIGGIRGRDKVFDVPIYYPSDETDNFINVPLSGKFSVLLVIEKNRLMVKTRAI